MDYKYRPMYLPQVSAPFSLVFSELKDRDIKFDVLKKNINDIKPSQGIAFSDKINSIPSDNIKAIFLSNDNQIIDGHHRYGSALSSNNEQIKSIVIDLPFMDSIRVLNQIQDLYEYEIKVNERKNNEKEKDFLQFLESIIEEDENSVGEKKKIIGYRKNKINNNSNIGNFFMLDEIEGYGKYEIEFDNLLDTNKIGNLIFKSSETPIETLSKLWFPNLEFKKIGDDYGVDYNMLINRAVAEKGNKLGYDGIKYGDVLLQGLK